MGKKNFKKMINVFSPPRRIVFEFKENVVFFNLKNEK